MEKSSMNNPGRILVVGGVAGGASCAARARRLSEEAEIIVFERGPHVSFANCGLPYYVGDVIKNEEDLLVSTPEVFRDRFNIEVRLYSEVTTIDRKNKEIEVRDVTNGTVTRERYDSLVLATGSAPVKPPLPGIDLPGIFTVRNIPDSRLIKQWITDRIVKDAVVVGGGFIGLEMAENLAHLGLNVTIVEMLPHVLLNFDPEMAVRMHEGLESHNIKLALGSPVTGFARNDENGRITVSTGSGKDIPCDMAVLGIGVRPESKLAVDAGLRIGGRGGIVVDDKMRTSDDTIWAVGDAVEVTDFITGEPALIPLAGPANRQGRIAAGSILGRTETFRGVQATAVCRVFETTAAVTGVSEKTLQRCALEGNAIPYEKVYVYPSNHAEYYPGADTIALKLIYSTGDGRVLGAQAIGSEGVEKRIDVIAMAIQNGATVYDLEEAELSYSPQVGSAKDAVNIAGMVAANALKGDAPVVHWPDVPETDAYIIDVRTPEEYKEGYYPGAVNIPLGKLRTSMDKLPCDRQIWIYCSQGKRSYYACRILRLNGFDCRNISGGYQTRTAWDKLNT